MRLEELAGLFGIEILGFAVMSNHLHVVARTRPDVVRGWSDDEVAQRWWNLFPQRRNEDHSPAELTEFELNMIRNNKSAWRKNGNGCRMFRGSCGVWPSRSLDEATKKIKSPAAFGKVDFVRSHY